MQIILYVNGHVPDGGVIAVTEFGHRLEEAALNLSEPEPIAHNGDIMPFLFVADDAFGFWNDRKSFKAIRR